MSRASRGWRILEEREQQVAALKKRVNLLEGEVQRLQVQPAAQTQSSAIGPMGELDPMGRRLSGGTPTCCRWTADGTCGAVAADRLKQCTRLHEYLEQKTTTVQFADLDTCMGSPETAWAWKFDGAAANQVTLSNGDTVKAARKTPLKVEYPANCATVEPTVHVQMNTVLDGSLTLGAGTVLNAPELVFRYDFPPALTVQQSHTFGAGTQGVWADVPDLTHTPPLIKSKTLLLVHYKISFGISGATSGTYLACRLMVDSVEQTAARAIGSGTFGSVSGTWIGEVVGPSTTKVVKVQCRSSVTINLDSDYMTKTLQVAIIG